MNYLLLLVALMLSAVAAWYSIAGLVAIFAAAVIPIIIMGGTLEIAKLVVASWLYRNWKEVPVLIKTYFSVALIVLMTLTSMGIFGFLSKAHLDQAVPTGDVVAKVEIIEDKIKLEKENINEYRKMLNQLDTQVDQTIARTATDTTDKGIRRSISVRKNQAKERKELTGKIETSQKEISKLNIELQPVRAELRKVEAEVGPIKYIAALIYGDSADQTLLESAVRIVILMIVSVFDPLAVLMLVAANWSLKNARREDFPGWTKQWVPNSETWPPYEPDYPDPLTEEQMNNIKEQSGIDQDMEMTQKFFDDGKDLAKAIDENYGYFPNDYTSTQSYLHTPMTWINSDTTEGLVPKQETEWDPIFSKMEFEPKQVEWGDDVDTTPQPKKSLGRYLEKLAAQNAKLKNTSLEEEIQKLQK